MYYYSVELKVNTYMYCIISGEEIKKLYERIKKLILRNEQLCSLLKDAGIRVPSECGVVKNFKKSKPWSNRISPEQAKILAEKENQSKKPCTIYY